MRRLRRVQRAGGEVASCDVHLAAQLRTVTPEHNGDENDTHLVVRRLSDTDATVLCAYPHGGPHRAAWVLIPQAVLR